MSDELINVGQSARKKLRDIGGYHAEEVVAQNVITSFRDDFGGTELDPKKWQLVQTGPGMAISFPGSTTSYLNINSGVTPNSETIIRALPVFQLPVRLNCGVSASQRIANTEFFVEYIECDADGVPLTTEPNQTNAGTSSDYAALKFDGVATATALMIARGGGAPETVSASTPINTTVATGTSPNFVPANALDLTVTGEHLTLFSSGIDQIGAGTAARRITQCAPDPKAFYRLQMRVRNLATAPASATNWRAHFIRVQSDVRMPVELMGGVGGLNGVAGVSVLGQISTGEATLLPGTGYELATLANSTHLGVIKNSGGNLFELTARGVAGSSVAFKFFNKSTAPTLGTDIPLLTVFIAAGATFPPLEFGRLGKRFTVGIAIAVTSGAGDLDTTAPTVSGAHLSATFV